MRLHRLPVAKKRLSIYEAYRFKALAVFDAEGADAVGVAAWG